MNSFKWALLITGALFGVTLAVAPSQAEVLAAVRQAMAPAPAAAPPTISLETVKSLAKTHGMMIAMCWMEGATVARVTWIPTPKRWPADETSLDTLAKALMPSRALKTKIPSRAASGGFIYAFEGDVFIATFVQEGTLASLVQTFPGYSPEDFQRMKKIQIIQGEVEAVP